MNKYHRFIVRDKGNRGTETIYNMMSLMIKPHLHWAFICFICSLNRTTFSFLCKSALQFLLSRLLNFSMTRCLKSGILSGLSFFIWERKTHKIKEDTDLTQLFPSKYQFPELIRKKKGSDFLKFPDYLLGSNDIKFWNCKKLLHQLYSPRPRNSH